jgi:preprotein translocase subunit SecG
MSMLMNFVLAIQILAALVMIGLVLIQHGKGADMGASFGSGASGSLFGATGSANFLSRSTAACAAVFFVCTLALAYTSNDRPAQATTTSILDRPANAASASPGTASSGAAAIPGAASGVVAPPAPVVAPAPAAAPASVSASGAGAIPQK